MAKKKDKSKDQNAAQVNQGGVPEATDDLQERVEALQQERDDLFEKLQRIGADYANYQKRVPKQVADSVAYEKEKILKSLLPVLDNYEHSLSSAESTDDVTAILKGVRIVHDQMLDAITGHGVMPIEATGQRFDPKLHEAMMRREDPEQEDNVVLEEFQKGYALGDRVLRPSKVIVNKLPAEPAPEPIEETDQAVETDDVLDSESSTETEEV